MVPALVQHLANLRHEGHVSAQRGGEQLLARVGVGGDELAAGLAHHQVAVGEGAEAEQLQRLADRQQFVGL